MSFRTPVLATLLLLLAAPQVSAQSTLSARTVGHVSPEDVKVFEVGDVPDHAVMLAQPRGLAFLDDGEVGAGGDVAATFLGAAPLDTGELSRPAGLPDELERLQVFVGDWDVVERVWSAPGTEPVEIRQTSTARMIMDGRFLEIRDRSVDGTYQFIGWHGYHTAKGKFINVAISNRRTDINPGDCVFSDAGRYQCVFEGINEPIEGDRTESIRGVAMFEGPDKYTWKNIRTLPDGTEFVFREVTYTRQTERRVKPDPDDRRTRHPPGGPYRPADDA